MNKPGEAPGAGWAGFMVSVSTELVHAGGMTHATTRVIDLRSDTVTKPTAPMREAMARAEVGDDVFGDDPTVKELEAETAALLGKEAALFTASGTMANQLALRSHTEPGDEILVEAQAHIYYSEGGAPAALSGVMCRCLEGQRGVFSGADVEAVLRPDDPHFPRTRLVCVENTHNRGGGKIWPKTQLQEVGVTARKHGLLLHLDGARLWNACVATGVSERDYARHFDSVSVCFSKGLGAPVGSALVGDAAFIARARRFRKQFGGGMRQAGILAAAALYALEHHRARLGDDHENARIFAQGIAEVPGIDLDLRTVETNMIVFNVRPMPAEAFCAKAKDAGVWMLPRNATSVRAVTHLDVHREQVHEAIQIIRKLMTT